MPTPSPDATQGDETIRAIRKRLMVRLALFLGSAVVCVVVLIIIRNTAERSIPEGDRGCDRLCFEGQDCCVPSVGLCGSDSCFCVREDDSSYCKEKSADYSPGVSALIIIFLFAIITLLVLSCFVCYKSRRAMTQHRNANKASTESNETRHDEEAMPKDDVTSPKEKESE